MPIKTRRYCRQLNSRDLRSYHTSLRRGRDRNGGGRFENQLTRRRRRRPKKQQKKKPSSGHGWLVKRTTTSSQYNGRDAAI